MTKIYNKIISKLPQSPRSPQGGYGMYIYENCYMPKTH